MIGAWFAAAPAYHIERAPVRRIEAVLTMRADTPAMEAREWILFAARPPKLPGQADLSTALSPPGRPTTELSRQRRGVVWARVPTRGKQWTSGITVKARYRATLFSRRLRDGPPAATAEPVAPLVPQQRRFNLQATPLIDFDAQPLQQWLDKHRLHRGEDEGEIAFARRVYAVIVRSLLYELRPEMDRRASAVCTADRSDCAGLSALFVAAMRANKVPARLLVGRTAKELTDLRFSPAARQRRPHVRAEFFVEGVGWAPVDPSDEILTRSIRRTVYFGYDPGDMLVLHLNDELILSTIHFGRQTVESLQGIRFWVVGQGSSEGSTMSEDWQVRQLPLEEDETDKPKQAAGADSAGQ
jgi:transglutaminase-like putative cysteine protease